MLRLRYCANAWLILAACLCSQSHAEPNSSATTRSDCPQNIQLGSATCTASQTCGVVVIVANGMQIQTGYQHFFEQLPQTVYPPMFAFWQAAPSSAFPFGPSAFSAWTMFQAPSTVEKVRIFDAAGEHEIVVEQLGNFGSRSGGGVPLSRGDGPCPVRPAGDGKLIVLGDGPSPVLLGSDGPTPLLVAGGSGTGGPVIKMQIGQFLEDTRAFARLKKLMEHAGLLSALNQPGRFTLFAARNEAFGTDDEWEAILNDPVKLKELAEYHLIECEALSTKEVRGLRSLLMANDKQVWVHADPRLWLRDQADGRIEIWQPDLTFANGVVHIVDNVLWPWREESKLAEAHACAAATSKIELVTAYHVHPIELNVAGEARQIHRIYLRVKLTGTTGRGELQLDATSCVDVDFFGEPSNCSPGIYAPSTIELRQVYAADTADKGRALFAIFGADFDEDAFLVVPRDARDSYRLILGPSAEEGEAWRASHVLTLERDRATAR